MVYTNNQFVLKKIKFETSIKLWEAFKPKYSNECIFGLQNIAKEVNNSGYKLWLQKNNEYLNIKTLDVIFVYQSKI